MSKMLDVLEVGPSRCLVLLPAIRRLALLPALRCARVWLLPLSRTAPPLAAHRKCCCTRRGICVRLPPGPPPAGLPQPSRVHVRSAGRRHQAGAAPDHDAALQHRPQDLLLHPVHQEVLCEEATALRVCRPSQTSHWPLSAAPSQPVPGTHAPAERPAAAPICHHCRRTPCRRTPCSGGVGMNLIGADTVIFYDSGGQRHPSLQGSPSACKAHHPWPLHCPGSRARGFAGENLVEWTTPARPARLRHSWINARPPCPPSSRQTGTRPWTPRPRTAATASARPGRSTSTASSGKHRNELLFMPTSAPPAAAPGAHMHRQSGQHRRGPGRRRSLLPGWLGGGATQC